MTRQDKNKLKVMKGLIELMTQQEMGAEEINVELCEMGYDPKTIPFEVMRGVAKKLGERLRESKEENKNLLRIAREAYCRYPHIAEGCVFLPMEGISRHTDLCRKARDLVIEIDKKNEAMSKKVEGKK